MVSNHRHTTKDDEIELSIIFKLYQSISLYFDNKQCLNVNVTERNQRYSEDAPF